MPCRSEHMEPNVREAESERVAKLIKWLFLQLRMTIPEYVEQATTSIYGNTARLDEMTALLCGTIREMSEDEINANVYDGRNANARKLADWWDNHEEFDRKRKELEAKEKAADERRNKTVKMIASVRSKITQEEWEAVQHYFSEDYYL